jgi:hypothetical protein
MIYSYIGMILLILLIIIVFIVIIIKYSIHKYGGTVVSAKRMKYFEFKNIIRNIDDLKRDLNNSSMIVYLIYNFGSEHGQELWFCPKGDDTIIEDFDNENRVQRHLIRNAYIIKEYISSNVVMMSDIKNNFGNIKVVKQIYGVDF